MGQLWPTSQLKMSSSECYECQQSGFKQICVHELNGNLLRHAPDCKLSLSAAVESYRNRCIDRLPVYSRKESSSAAVHCMTAKKDQSKK